MSTSEMIGQSQKMLVTVALLLGAGNAFSTEYEYRDLLGNTLAPQKCATQTEAEARAKEQYNIDKYVKGFCETQGYGWHVSEIKETGKLVCNECSGQSSKYPCHLEDQRVTCKHIKPGSVGMLPGKG
jgi:hypothetical protein